MKPNREELVLYLKTLRDHIIKNFEAIEQGPEKFERSCWDYSKGHGGGEMSVIRSQTFEKAAVNWSGVGGDSFPMQDGLGEFFATGVSLITHMSNPYMPTVHFNIRYIEAGDKWWLGGGYDLTPMGFDDDIDTSLFHSVAKQTLDNCEVGLYEQFSEQARKYFTIKHYDCERGVGGIFFDHYNSGDWEKDLKMWQGVGDTFLNAIMPIYTKKLSTPFSEEDRQKQLKYRARYVEFNLLYDRGTKFGFESGGNPEAILCSMPPLASW